jgi:glycosyltransferase involved in cell wall biosynthesis
MDSPATEGRHGEPRGTVQLRILILAAYYLPGEKAGGPVWSMAGLVEALGDEFDFRIATLDHDLGESVPYENVDPDVWTRREHVAVRYLSPRGVTVLSLRRLLQSPDYDLLFVNGLFSRRFSMVPVALRRFGLIRDVPLLIAPRGELNGGALAIRSLRKKIFLRLTNAFRLYRDIYWLASTDLEVDEVRASVPYARRIGVARNIGPAAMDEDSLPAHSVEKQSGKLSAVFLSRISRKKNLAGALSALGAVVGDVQFFIYGPMEDAAYFAECERLIARLPANVRVHYLGNVPHRDVAATFAKHDLFVFPTFGENFGHVIYEALRAGCPVLLSDTTPWRGLEAASAGWDLPLDDIGAFSSALQRSVDAGPEEWIRMRAGARSFARLLGGRDAAIEQHRRVLREACAKA